MIVGKIDGGCYGHRGWCIERVGLRLPQLLRRLEANSGQRIVGPTVRLQRLGGATGAAE